MRLQNKVREARQAAGLTQIALADVAGVSLRTIINLELGDVTNPRSETAHRIATALGWSVADMFAFVDDDAPLAVAV